MQGWKSGKAAAGLLLAGLVLIAVVAFAATPAQKSDGTESAPKRSYGAIDVILYQTSWCPYCTKAREFLQNSGVSLVIYDIEKDPSKQTEMLSKSGSPGVPVVDIEGTVIRGYSAEEMRAVIERKRRE